MLTKRFIYRLLCFKSATATSLAARLQLATNVRHVNWYVTNAPSVLGSRGTLVPGLPEQR